MFNDEKVHRLPFDSSLRPFWVRSSFSRAVLASPLSPVGPCLVCLFSRGLCWVRLSSPQVELGSLLLHAGHAEFAPSSFGPCWVRLSSIRAELGSPLLSSGWAGSPSSPWAGFASHHLGLGWVRSSPLGLSSPLLPLGAVRPSPSP